MTRDDIEQLPEQQFKVLYSDVMSVWASRQHAKGVIWKNTVPWRLAKLNVGDFLVLDWKWPRHLTQEQRRRAREICGDTTALWAARWEREGLRVERIK